MADLSRRIPKDYRPLLLAAANAGFRVRSKNHGILVQNDKGSVMLPLTPSKYNRAYENTRAELKRLGVEV